MIFHSINRRGFPMAALAGLGVSAFCRGLENAPLMVARSEKKRVRAVLSYQIHCPNMVASKWSAYAAIAPNFPGQDQTRTQMVPAPVESRDQSPENREIIGLVLPGQGSQVNTLSVTVTYEATLYSRVLRPRVPGDKVPTVTPLRPVDRTNYLASRGDINHAAAEFGNWLQREKLRREKGEADTTFAGRAYLHLKRLMRYDYQPLSSRVATQVCKAGKSDCGGLSILFVAVMRANAIPARVLYGRWASSAKPSSTLGNTPYYQWHVKSEFHARDVGWVPVDLSGAVEANARDPDSMAFFGNDPGDFITFHFNPNLIIDSGLFGPKPVHNLQYPMWWWTGQGSADPKRLVEDWQVSTVSN